MSIEPYLDETKLSSGDLPQDFLQLSQLLSAIVKEELRPRKRSTIYEMEVSAGLNFATFLYSKGHIDEDLRLALMVQIDQMAVWDDGMPPPIPTTMGFAERRRSEGAATLCIVLKPHALAQPESNTCIVGDLVDLNLFLREIPELLDLSEQDFIKHCSRVYDRLYFKPDIHLEIRKFSRAHKVIRKDLSAAFAALNDDLCALLDTGISPKELAAHFGALTRFEISPESSLTHKNTKAMRERDVMVNGNVFTCEWHLKIEVQEDRIHIHFFHGNIGNGRQLLVGIFCKHLTI